MSASPQQRWWRRGGWRYDRQLAPAGGEGASESSCQPSLSDVVGGDSD